MAEKEELTRKKRCRNGHRTSAKRIMASVGETLMSVAEKSQLTPHIAKLKQQKSTLEAKLKSLREQDEAILALVSVEDIELEIEQGDITREKIESVIIEVQMALEEYEKSSTTQLNIENNVITPVTPTQPTTSITGNNSETASNHGDNSIQADPSNFMNNYTKIPTVKLPKLNLRAFRGDPTSWATFWDTFESSIHNNPTLSSIDKFNYLSSLVEGTAADAIAGLTLTTLNYEEAIKILKKRFGNKQLAINKHMDILLNLEPVTSPHNLKGLRTLYDTVESHIRALKSLGVQAETYGNLLCSMLLNKLPQELCIIVSREIQGDVWELGHLLELIEKELEARERATANTNRETWPHYQTNKFSKPQPSISTLQTGGTSPTCTYCQQSHTSNSCTNVSNITARIDIIKRSGRCFLCLRKNHLSRDCNSKSRCHKCNGKHHISICTKNSSHNHAQKTPSDTELKQQQHEQTSESKISSDKPSRSNQSGNSGTKSLFTSTKTPILLQTAKATILPVSRNGKSGNVRVILDGGSQRSYITSRTQDLLSLPTERTETMSIKTFGSGEENLTTCDSVNFILESHTDKVQLSLSAFVVPTICEPLQYQLVSQSRHNYPHLHDLVLADDSMGELDSEVDILIGCDQYWDIVTGEIRKGTNGPTAINTNLGWVLSGPVENHSQQRLEASVNVSSTHVLQLETPPSQPMHHEDDQQLRRFWDLESLGISKEEKSVVEEFTSTIGFKAGRYHVELPWKEHHPLLPDNVDNHCPGRDNPADIPSRGIKPTELTSNELWSCGPEWLTDVETHSCQDEKEITPPKECLVEVRSTKSRTVNLIVNTTPQTLSNIINIENFGTLDRLVRVTAYVLRFVKILKAKTRKSDLDVEPSLTVNEIRESRELWIKEMQRKLPEKNQFEQWKAEFGLYTDEQDSWRCKGRLEKANLPQSAKHPILVDKEHYFASLIVYDSHRRVMHNGVKETLTDIRSQYWIVRGRQFVRKLIGRCSICRRFEGKPYQAPPPPPLPEFRVRETPPFTATGIDFLGPLYVRTHEKSEKVWVCLYTCCVTRAVHLDVVPTLTKEGFIRSFRRFTARRGVPSTIVSDNAGTFKAASREIKTMLRDPEIRRFFVGMNITWSFNLPKAPWWGGIFERLVKSTKRCLKKTVGGAQLTYEELLTVVAEVEMILNSRPISYVSTEDLQEPLTPSHLLTGRRLLSMPEQDIGNDILDPEFSLNDKDLSRRMKHLSTLMNHFWTRWRDEYLMELRNSHRGKNDNGKGTIRAGDIVVVHDESQPRACWRLGKVERLINGEDGNVRGAIVRISPKGKRPTTLKRSVRLLYPLEVRSDSEAEENRYGKNELDEAIGNEMNQVEVKRPRREAAKRGEERRRKWIEELNDS